MSVQGPSRPVHNPGLRLNLSEECNACPTEVPGGMDMADTFEKCHRSTLVAVAQLLVWQCTAVWPINGVVVHVSLDAIQGPGDIVPNFPTFLTIN